MGVIKVTQNVGTTNKVCYPFMKGNKTPIAFCPVWYKNSATSFLPAGLKVMFKPDAENDKTTWETLQFYRNADHHTGLTIGITAPSNSYILGAKKFVSPYHFNSISTTNTAVNINKLSWNAEVNTTTHITNNNGTLKVRRSFMYYPTSATDKRVFGIVPYTEGKNATIVFGCIAAVPTAWSDKDGAGLGALWYSTSLSNALVPTNGGMISATRFSARGEPWSAGGYSSYYGVSFYKPNANNAAAWPDNNNIFTGLKYLGTTGTDHLLFWQWSATLGANYIFTPPVYSVGKFAGQGTYSSTQSAKIYDAWIGLSF